MEHKKTTLTSVLNVKMENKQWIGKWLRDLAGVGSLIQRDWIKSFKMTKMGYYILRE
tara:strand:- start:586 stop:756 length:171 start_codon:yes stop_codon:yes gene_type:complete